MKLKVYKFENELFGWYYFGTENLVNNFEEDDMEERKLRKTSGYRGILDLEAFINLRDFNKEYFDKDKYKKMLDDNLSSLKIDIEEYNKILMKNNLEYEIFKSERDCLNAIKDLEPYVIMAELIK